MVEFNPGGTEHKVGGSGLVPLGGRLPHYLELRSSRLIDAILVLLPNPIGNRSEGRKKINRWLYTRTRPSFYLEMNEHLHLAYADQRDRHGSQHWWRLFFDDAFRERAEQAVNSSALTVGTNAPSNSRQASGTEGATREWGGMYFRSEAEVRIAEALDARGVLFFGNCRGRVAGEGSPISVQSGWLTGRVELDFLVFHKGKSMILEVDGQQHQEGVYTIRDYVRDRVLLREGIPTARFLAAECVSRSAEVVIEFLNMWGILP